MKSKNDQKSCSDEIELLEHLFEFIVPKYREAHDIIVSMLDLQVDQESRIAELGCGYGELSRRLLEMLPLALVFGLDKNKEILEKGRKNLEKFPDRFLPFERDLNKDVWSNELQPLDAVVSSFTLDYLAFERHKQLASEVFAILNPKGRFVTCEFFRSEDNRINRIFHDLEIQYIQNALKKGTVNEEQIDLLAKSTILRQEHHVCTVDKKVEWLREAGFDSVEVPWRFLNLAVISAVR